MTTDWSKMALGYKSNGRDRIHLALGQPHPNEFEVTTSLEVTNLICTA